MTARQHHYLPQCYLKGFAHHRKKPKVHVIDGKTRKTFATHPENIAQERDFHTINVEGLEPDALENAFSKVESDIAPALIRVSDAGSLGNIDDRTLVLNLTALIAVKNPRHRESMRDFSERVSKGILQQAVATPERWEAQVHQMKEAGVWAEDQDPDYEGMRDFVQSDEYKISMDTGSHLAMELSGFDTLLPFFIRRHWAVLKAPSKTSGFVTADHPVSLFWSDPSVERGYVPPGLGLRGTTVLFPLSSRVAIMGTFELDVDQSIDLTFDQVAEINSQTISNADRQIYARDGDFDYRSMRTGRLTKGVNFLGELPGK